MENLNAVTQEQVDSMVARIKKLVTKHGGDSEKLATVRKLYAMFHRCPEHACFGFLTAAVEEVEKGE
jgi:hypothetical protein